MRACRWIPLLLVLCACRSTRDTAPRGAQAQRGSAAEEAQESSAGGTAADKWSAKFEGNRELSSATLRSALGLALSDWAAHQFQEAFVDDAAFDLEVFYRSNGYPAARVNYEQVSDKRGPRVIFQIDEGPRVLISEITAKIKRVEDDEAVFSEAEIGNFYTGPRNGLFGSGSPVFIESHVLEMAGSIVGAYIERGYSEASVAPPSISFNDKGTRASVHLEIEQGPRFRVGRVELTPDSVLPTEIAAACAQAMREVASKKTWYPRLPFELRGVLFDLLANAGYADAEVEARVTRDEPAREMHIDMQITPGPHVRIVDVRFEGNARTRPEFLRSRMKLEAGETFDNAALRESVRRLYRTGLFGRVDAKLEQTQGSERELVVRLEELPSLELYVEPGWGSYEQARLTLGARENNFRGSGLRLSGEATLAIRARRVQVGLTDPWFLSRDLIGGLSVSYMEREEPSFTRIESAISPSVTKEWTRRDSTNVAYRYEDSRAINVEIVNLQDEIDVDALNTSSVIVTQSHDRRDGIIAPVAGLNLRASVEVGDQSIGSQLDYVRGLFDFEHYLALREGTILAFGMRTGVIVPYSGEETPLQQRFFNGGENTVRSYMQSQLGPKDTSDNPIGGEAFSVINLELRQDIGASNLQVAAFVDAGNVALRHQDYFEFEDIGYGIGLGLRYMLPIGPLRLDAGVNPDPDGGEDEYVLHFALGMAF